MHSVLELFYKQFTKQSNLPCLHFLEEQSYSSMYYEKVFKKAVVLSQWLTQQTQPKDKVFIWSNNCWQWIVTDIACQLAEVVSVPIYPTIGKTDLLFIVNDAQPVVIFVDDLSEDRLECLTSKPSVKQIVPFFSVEKYPITGIVQDFEDITSDISDVSIDQQLWCRDRLTDVFTVLYTSGTTGMPKAVPLTHYNIVQNVTTVLQRFPISSDDATLSFLPLSHILERTVGYYCMLASGGQIYFAQSIETVAKDLLLARPTILISVPRLYEKIYHRVKSNATGLKSLILKLALFIGRHCSESNFLWKLSYQIVFKKIHARTGGNIRFLVSGGASIPLYVEQFFNAIGLTIIQGYGLTETSPIIAVNLLSSPKMGTVGLPLSNLDVQISDEGELLVKGDSVFSGYLNMTNEDVFDDNGYFRTGDLATIDSDGYITIKGRKKEIIVLSNGKNVSPIRIEEQMMLSDLISQIVVVGEDKSYLSALIVPDFEYIQSVFKGDLNAEKINANIELKSLILNDIKRLSADFANFETIKKIQLVSSSFSVDGGELTPTLKLRRKEINKKYHDLIDSLYDIN